MTHKEEHGYEHEEDVNDMLDEIDVDPEMADELQESMYDQLTQYTTGELKADIQMAGPSMSFESYRRAYHYGKKKTAENVHRARNRVSRPEIAETMDDMEEKYNKWKKDSIPQRYRCIRLWRVRYGVHPIGLPPG